MKIPLEDSWVDVLSKAANGQGLTPGRISEMTGSGGEAVQALFSGEPDTALLAKVSTVLGLHAASLISLAKGNNHPAEVTVPDGLAGFNTPFDDMTVNNYLVWDPATRAAAVFDTGTDIDPVMEAVRRHGLHVESILLTHSHGDHVIELDRLKEKAGATAWIGDREPLEGATPFAAGKTFSIGGLTVETRLTWGHSAGGVTYVVGGLGDSPVAIVGDSIFARSAGGGRVSYKDAIGTIRSCILTLPPDTILCPGHGPLTTVKDELANNPFFAG